jgi:superfamily II DNA or RNA helicase
VIISDLSYDKMPQAGKDASDDSSLKIRLRSYQHEMLKKSLERNVIVAMPTGSKERLIRPDLDPGC